VERCGDDLKQLAVLLKQVSSDASLKPTHIALFSALCQAWISSSCQNPFQVSRSRLMQLSHIRSKTNYHRCIRDLIRGGYLVYEPSYHPKLATTVTLVSKMSSCTVRIETKQS
jgi:hypothetical protein